MQILDWTFLNAYQAGALFALAAAYGADGMARRDGMMRWMALACLALGLRHAIAQHWGNGAGLDSLAARAQLLMICLGFLSLCLAAVQLFPRVISARFPRWMALGLLPDCFLALFPPTSHLLYFSLEGISVFTQLAGCVLMIRAAMKAGMAGDPMGVRFFYGFLAASFPLLVEVAATTLFHLDIHLSGLSLLILAVVIGSSWQQLATQSLREQVQEAEAEGETWRSLIQGPTFRTDRSSPFMDVTFGGSWANRIRYEDSDHLTALDGTLFRIRRHPLPRQHVLGVLEREEGTRPGVGGFLTGWTVALGMDDPAEVARITAWLLAWGAEPTTWSPVPPREGPYPSVLIWAREPSILAVWREDDLLRRRARWIQVGGPRTDGPHARLESPVGEAELRSALEGLLGPVREH